MRSVCWLAFAGVRLADQSPHPSIGSLRYLSLSNNRLPSLPLPDPAAHSPLTFLPPKLETLRLAKNAVGDWSTVDLLNERLGALRVLWLGGNPITSVGAAPARVGDPVDEDEEDRRERRRVRDVRAGVIARVRGLAVLDGSEVRLPGRSPPSEASH